MKRVSLIAPCWKTLAAILFCLVISPAQAESLNSAALVTALQKGGYVLVMRHASSPRTLPTAATAAPGNTTLERQLDDHGLSTARAMGAALKKLKVPVGAVWSSPTYRALETIRAADLPTPVTQVELGEGDHAMRAAVSSEVTWLRTKAAETPKPGTNTIIVTHFPNVTAAFGEEAANVADGEALMFHPNGTAAPTFVTRIKIEDWPVLAGE